jgi:hypothetical protein
MQPYGIQPLAYFELDFMMAADPEKLSAHRGHVAEELAPGALTAREQPNHAGCLHTQAVNSNKRAANFKLRQDSFLATGKTHVAGQGKLTSHTSRPPANQCH